ncbi:unnamed protein product [Closterium sp. Yama58-4]|nr:unnamed protein product [Closterium sp. Yama58-4]
MANESEGTAASEAESTVTVIGPGGWSLSDAKITHVIFDLDGTLIDTESAVTEVARILVERYGKVWTGEGAEDRIGKRPIDGARATVQRYGLPCTPEELLAQSHVLVEERWSQAKPLPGAHRLMQHLRACGIPMAVASSSPRRNVNIKLSFHSGQLHVPREVPAPAHGSLRVCSGCSLLLLMQHLQACSPFLLPLAPPGATSTSSSPSMQVGCTFSARNGPGKMRDVLGKLRIVQGWTDMLQVLVGGDEVEHGKPRPDIFLRAAELMGASPSNCLVVEDSPCCPPAAAHHLLPSLLDFQPQHWGLPPFSDCKCALFLSDALAAAVGATGMRPSAAL